MISPNQRTSHFNRDAAAYTMVEILVVMAIILAMAAMLLGSIGRQGSSAEKKVIYLQNRDALVTISNFHEWNYANPIDPNSGRLISELDFDGSVREHDLFYLWEIIQPHFNTTRFSYYFIKRFLVVGHFSTGMKRRLALARIESLVCQLWILDEPSLGLDEKALKTFIYILRCGF